MRKATITRTETGDDGTFGAFESDGWKCFTLELPWRNNASGKSCIPAGTYRATWVESPKHGECYQLIDVPGRSHIQIHSANWAYQLLGCIAPGATVEPIHGRKGVTASRKTLAILEAHMAYEDFELEVRWQDGTEIPDKATDGQAA